MLTNAQRMAILDELQVTRGMWPSMPDGEHAIRGYAEHLDSYSPEEIHAGFKLARLNAEHTYPKVQAVVASCNAVVGRRAYVHDRPEGDDRITPCCEGHVVVETWKVTKCAFSHPFPEGMTVDRYGIWHTSQCFRRLLGERRENAA